MMDLDRATLAKLDRRKLAGLNREERFQMVRVPVTPATWSTWKRYCGIAGISIGRAISAFVDRELASVLGESNSESGSWFEDQAQQRLREREATLTKRADELAKSEDRMQRWSEHLRDREREVEAREWRLEPAKKLTGQPIRAKEAKIGRNEPARAVQASSTSTATARPKVPGTALHDPRYGIVDFGQVPARTGSRWRRRSAQPRPEGGGQT